MSDFNPYSFPFINLRKGHLAKFINDLIAAVLLLLIPYLNGSTARMITNAIKEKERSETSANNPQGGQENDNLIIEGAWSRGWALVWMYLTGGVLCGMALHLIVESLGIFEDVAFLIGGIVGCAAMYFTLHCARSKTSFHKLTGLVTVSTLFTLFYGGVLFHEETNFDFDEEYGLLLPISLSLFLIIALFQVIAVLPAWLMYRELETYRADQIN